MTDIRTLPAKEVFDALETSPQGLTSEEAKKRLSQHGPNALIEKKGASLAYKFVVHFKDLFSVLLLFAALLAAISAMLDLAIIILIVVVINIVFSLFQEWRAEKAMQTLRSWVPEYAKAYRDGELTKVPVKELVLGDVILLEEGDRVPADARLIEAYDLWTNNVPLTGESEPQPRNAGPIENADAEYLDASNLVFMSTSVARGRGKAVVASTGMKTKFGQIAGLTQEIGEEQSPLQREISYTARYDFVLAIVVGSVFFLVSWLLLHVEFYSSILFMIGVMVALVPEGLQVTVSSALAINVLKMVRENVLVKKLSAVQTLGSVTCICTDKTGTITKGEMTLKKVWIPDKVIDVSGVGYAPSGEFTYNGKKLGEKEQPAVEKLLEISALCNNAKIQAPSDQNRLWSIIGDPTDGALLVAAMKYGLNTQVMNVEKPIVRMMPFDSERKRMTTIHSFDNKTAVYSKGAPRSILSICDKMKVDSTIEKMTEQNMHLAEEKIREFADSGLRVIALAYKEIPKSSHVDVKEAESNMVFAGLAAMKDPPRPEVKPAVQMAKQAGIKTVIITGDYGPTAQAIAEEVEIVNAENCRIIRGVDLDKMNDQQMVEKIRKGDVIFARVSPEHKLRIVKAIKDSGEVVAVTGDGANDAPSLKEADIGIAMGASGTDVAREAADIVLLDDSFASIVKAVESGRVIYENIRKFILYVFSHNWAELIPYILYVLLNIPLPLLVVQILAIDLVIDVIPSLALSREPAELGIMQEPPRSIRQRLFSTGVLLRSLYIGIIIAAGGMIGCLSAWSAGGWHWGLQLDTNSTVYAKGTTMMFAGIVIAQVGNVLASRTSKTSIFRTSPTSNKWIWIGIVAQVSIIASMVYVPFLQDLFGTAALNQNDWAFLALIAIIVVFAEEIRKLLSRRLSK